jgi:long-chain acyl-CoA synthetase
VINQTKLTAISCAGNYLPSMIKLKKDQQVDSLVTLISFDAFTPEIKQEAKEVGIELYHFDEVIAAGKNSTKIVLKRPTPESVYMFCYTSGTTGDPKAAMLTHSNFISVSAACIEHGIDLNENDSSISYLPLAHSFEKCLFVVGIICGCQYGFYSGDPLKLLDDMKVLKPTIFPSVPRLFNRIYDRIQAGLKEKSAFK